MKGRLQEIQFDSYQNCRQFTLSLIAILVWSPATIAQIDHNSPFPPHRIIDNVYYVGTGHLSIFLIVTPDGHILINSGFESTVPSVLSSIEALGFSYQDIKILLGSHWHHDHMEGDALIKDLTGAEVAVMHGDVRKLRTVRPGGKRHPIDRVLHDGERIELGGTTLVAQAAPGHTQGCTNWVMKVEEDGQTYDLVIVGSYGINSDYILIDNPDYPNIVEDNRRTFAMARNLPVDIFLGAHPSIYHMWGKYEKLQTRSLGDPNPFIDRDGYLGYVDVQEQHFEEKFRAENAQKVSD